MVPCPEEVIRGSGVMINHAIRCQNCPAVLPGGLLADPSSRDPHGALESDNLLGESSVELLTGLFTALYRKKIVEPADVLAFQRKCAAIHEDLSKAFDSLNHSILLRKLEGVGASPSVLSWFNSYLTRRLQSVRIGTSTSRALPITHGVPQGAILSALLFTIYLNDLPSVIRHCSLESYVDDSKLFVSFPRNDMNDGIKAMEQW